MKIDLFIKPVFNLFVILFSIIILSISLHNFNLEDIRHILFKSDAYINYAGGFMRRGLDGEIIYRLCLFFKWTPWKAQAMYALLTILLFSILLIYFILRYEIPLLPLFSMSCLLCLLFYSKTGIRKDHIIFTFFLIYVVYLKKSELAGNFRIYIKLNFILIASILIHEITFIFFLFPTIIYFFILNQYKIDKQLIFAATKTLFFPFFVFLLCSFIFNGDQKIEQDIIQSWSFLGVKNIVFWTGVFAEPYYIWNFLKSELSYIYFILIFIFHFIFILLSTKVDGKKSKYIFRTLLFCQFTSAILLSLVASDFSRWIVYSSFTSIFFIFICKKKIIEPEIEEKQQKNHIYYIILFQYLFLGIPFSTGEDLKKYFESTSVFLIWDYFHEGEK